MNSCLYVGEVQHRRHAPRVNNFRYRIYMTCLDLDELDSVFNRFWLWSTRRPAIAWFRRADFHGSPEQSLAEAVRDTVERHTGTRPTGRIRLLTHLRHFGYSFNPVSFYYVHDAQDTQVETIVAEITNTPWRERHCYVLDTRNAESAMGGAQPQWQWGFDKAFHVSPFMPMDMKYRWRFSSPDQQLRVHMENWRDGTKQFDATLTLSREPITSNSLAQSLLSVPFVTLKVITLIHWQALKLWLKRIPVHNHPDKLNRSASHPESTP